MYNTLYAILGKTIDVDAVLQEAHAIAGDEPSMNLIMALSIKQIAEKFDMQVQELKDQLFVKTTTPEELDQKMGNLLDGAPLVMEDLIVPDLYEIPGLATAPIKLHKDLIDLDSRRNMKAADANLSEIVELTSNMTDEQLKEFDLKYRREAAAGDPTITVGPEDHDSKDIYLRMPISDKLPNTYNIVGLHAIGHAGPYEYTLHRQDDTIELIKTNFMVLEAWGNEYDDEHNMLGRGSFRLHTNDIEQYAKDMEAEGWERYEGPKRKT